MPRDDYGLSIPQRRSASVVRGGARFAPYTADVAGLKAHATCPEFYNLSSNNLTTPEAPLDSAVEVSSVATLVNSTFDQDKIDSPGDIALEKSIKSSDKKAKLVSRSIQQKKIDHFTLLVDLACKLMNDIWPQSTIPTIFRLQSGASYGYSPETRGMSMDQFPATQSGSDLVNLRKFITELLKRSRSTAATFQTALCYLEAVRPKVPELQQAETEGKGTRGEPVDHAIGRVSIDPNFLAVAEEENRKLARNNAKCKLRKPHIEPGFALPDLPSPLLCPRRTLMGALVLAAKFVQDKCYSNRAWAKLCGLPPREVSRCERALGDALGWRLWVGREMLTAFGGPDMKLERTTTSLLTSNFAEETHVALPPSLEKNALARAVTWPSAAQCPQPLRAADTEIIISPVPSLATSSGSGSSNWPSGNLSPTVPSPLPLFVSNDPSPYVSNKLRVANLIHTDTIVCDPINFDYHGHDENAFDMRIGNGQEVY